MHLQWHWKFSIYQEKSTFGFAEWHLRCHRAADLDVKALGMKSQAYVSISEIGMPEEVTKSKRSGHRGDEFQYRRRSQMNSNSN